MTFRDNYLGTGKTFAEWSLQRTVEAGNAGRAQELRLVQDRLGKQVRQQGEAIVRASERSTALLSAELRYLGDRFQNELARSTSEITNAVQDGALDVVRSIQTACDYLGAGLTELRFAVDRNAQATQRVLEALVSSLDVESRQYWAQGVRCYEEREYLLAREAFEKSLSRNVTNAFAHQYLGFIAVHEDRSDEALRRFELAVKFAESDQHRAWALHHRARAFHAIGNTATALELQRLATGTSSALATHWYERARYAAVLAEAGELRSVLTETIERDWNYWGVVETDPDFQPARNVVDTVRDFLREREHAAARSAVAGATTAFQAAAIDLDDATRRPMQESLRAIEEMVASKNVFHCRSARELALRLTDDIYKVVLERVEARERELSRALSLDDARVLQAREAARSQIQALERERDRLGSGYRRFPIAWLPFIVVCIFIAGPFAAATSSPNDPDEFLITFAVVWTVAYSSMFAFNALQKHRHVTIPRGNLTSRIRSLEATSQKEQASAQARHAAATSSARADIKALQERAMTYRSRQHS